MIYPKFPRRTLALILFCLVITLGAVGILFLVYFFNESSALLMDSSLKTVHGIQSPQYRQNQYTFEQKPAEGSPSPEKITNKSNSLLQNFDENIATSSASQEVETYLDKVEFPTNLLNLRGSKDPSLDTIYIDDVDRPTYNGKSKTELSNIDYFDTILVDHKNENVKNPPQKEISLRQQQEEVASMRSLIYRNNYISETLKHNNENERKLRINNKRRQNANRWNKTRLLKYAQLSESSNDDDDIFDLEIDTIASGSGDFIDDTEINEIFIKQINTKLIKKDNNPGRPPKRNNLKASRKKHHNYFYNNDSLPQLLLTTQSSLSPSSSAFDDRTMTNRVNQRSFKKSPSSALHPTTEQINVESPANKKWPPPELITSHHKSFINDTADSYSANSPTPPYSNNNNFQTQLELGDLASTVPATRIIESSLTNLRDQLSASENNEAWIETRTRRIMGNVKKSEERSRQLLLCEEAGGGELCRMLFKGHIND